MLRLRWILTTPLLAACGEPAPAPAATPAQLVAELEEQGKLPKLDRTDTLAGVDGDQDGIRDDIEVFIEDSYAPGAETDAARQLAATYQAAVLLDPADRAVAVAASERLGRAVSCVYSSFGTEPGTVVAQLKSVTTNTKVRLQAYLDFAVALDGTVMTLPEGDTCD